MKTNDDLEFIELTPEQQKTSGQRDVAIGIAIGCFVLLFYAVTIAELGSGVLSWPL